MIIHNIIGLGVVESDNLITVKGNNMNNRQMLTCPYNFNRVNQRQHTIFHLTYEEIIFRNVNTK